MKLSLTLLATASFGAPEKKKQLKLTNDRSSSSRSPVPCSAAVSDNREIAGGSPFESVDNGQSGQITFDSYTRWAHCYVDLGSSWDANGI